MLWHIAKETYFVSYTHQVVQYESNSSTYIDVQIQFEKEFNLRFIAETLECQMIQVLRQIENNQSSVFNTISKVRKENIDIFLKES